MRLLNFQFKDFFFLILGYDLTSDKVRIDSVVSNKSCEMETLDVKEVPGIFPSWLVTHSVSMRTSENYVTSAENFVIVILMWMRPSVMIQICRIYSGCLMRMKLFQLVKLSVQSILVVKKMVVVQIEMLSRN